jgi:catechol-2,3-dioxygenase
MPFRVDHIDHVEVFVRDITASMEWYERVLGLTEIYRWDPEPVMIGAGPTKLALFRAEPGARRKDSDDVGSSLRWHRVAWHTDRTGLEKAMAHLKTLGIQVRGPMDHGRTMSIYFKDPDGHPLEITCDAV